MGKMREEMQENNPLLQVYMKILPLTVAAIAVIFVLVKLISGLIAPDQLILNATYHDFEKGAVLMGPIRVAKDAAFEKEIKQKADKSSAFTELLVIIEGGEVEEEKPGIVSEDGSYFFVYEKTKLPETIYVKAPEWWHPIATSKEPAAPLEIGAQIDILEELGPTACGEVKFEITNIETTKISTGIFNINVTMTSAGDFAPSNVKLIMGEEVFNEWDGSSELVYNEETGFEERTLVFRYNRDLREDISDLLEDAIVKVEEYTVHKVYTDAEFTTNISGVEIVEVN
ncbi:MAG: hypothetical protein IKU20_03775 [Lachnospiraceae bacterium]|nr:hypothetical protein [Lachnospiraceae bacterium]